MRANTADAGMLEASEYGRRGSYSLFNRMLSQSGVGIPQYGKSYCCKAAFFLIAGNSFLQYESTNVRH
jgi:hypothetical protein